jgi:hypothetical protein
MHKKIDLLTQPHKEQREWMYSLSIKAGQLDFTDENQITAFESDFMALVNDLHDHAENEEMFILPLLLNRFPDAAEIFQHDHPQFKIQLHELVESWQDIQRATVEEKASYGLNFYRRFNRFIAEYLLHLAEEEQNILSVLNEHYLAEELIGVMVAFKTYREGHVTENVKAFIQTMTHPLSIDSLNLIYVSIKKHVPQPIFEDVCKLSKEALSAEQWAQVEKQI